MATYDVKQPTQQELVDRIRQRAEEDLLGAEIPDYASYLDAEHARIAFPNMSKKTLQSWTQGQWSEADVVKRISEYLKHAFDWANRERDMESLRAFTHFVAWTWLLGDRGFSKLIEVIPWDHYGKQHFRTIAERYGVDWKKLDDGKLKEMPKLDDVELTKEGGILLGGAKAKTSSFPSIEEIGESAWKKN